MSRIELNVTYIKILETVSQLNELSLFPTSNGIYKILNGVIDEDTKDLQGISTFGTLISLGSKKISNLVVMLVRYNYLKKVFDIKSNELYLQISDLGQSSLIEYKKHHKMNYKTKNKKFVPQIVKL